MTTSGERSFRIAQEVRSHAASGRRVGLLHAAPLRPDSRIAPEIQTCVRRGLASVVEASEKGTTGLLLVHGPSELDWPRKPLAGIRAEQAMLICHQIADYGVTRISQRLGVGVQWAPTNPWLRDAAPRNLKLMPDDHRPMLEALPPRSSPTRRSRARIGWIAGEGLPQPPDTEKAEIVALDEAQLSQLSLDRLSLLDGLAYFPAPEGVQLLDTVVLAAAHLGVAVAAAPWLKPHYKGVAVYCTPEEALSRLIAKASRKRPTDPVQPVSHPPAGSRQRPVMFVASNGVGVGHVSRLLAIARRMDPRLPLLFATQAQAVSAIERLGFLAEYMPSASYVGGDFELWDSWFRHDLETLVDAYDPALVVYDGNNPSHGLVGAVATRRDCRLAWIRRGLWGPLSSPFIDNSRWFDLIIEPGELKGQHDDGITARRRDEAVLVPPIRLLDEGELLTREEAARRLGLDPSRPSVLIQLGAGYNRDVVALVDNLISVLRRVEQLQICVAEWINGTQPLNYWQGVSYLRGYPLSQYFKAFDFSVSAAGYNTFHEIVNFDLPTIFIPNRHPSMDDQAGRSSHAQAQQAAFELDESELGDLPDLVNLLMDGKAREFLAGNTRSLHQSNGGADAARWLTQLHMAAQ
ncbi:glycosyltransferase [Devosia sp. CN2-171]|uniref:glycosyltransferase n=1 Tax=Devosia sp. CN2-171 TaxID=3400909 RepID=UPI003BF85925